MNVDWDALIGPDEPVIVAPWEHFTDLREHPEAAHTLPETAEYPELAEALLALNAHGSPVFTSKCDIWPLAADEIDPDEFDARPDEAQHGLAAYLDVIPAQPADRATFAAVEQLARAIVTALRSQNPAQPGRIDLVLRAADIDDQPAYAFTLYASAAGATESAAREHFRTVLHASVVATMRVAARAGE